MVIIMVGNKTDMRHLRAVTVEEGTRFAEEKSIFFIESSAVEFVNVDLLNNFCIIQSEGDLPRFWEADGKH